MVLLEAERILQGVTGRTTAEVSALPELIYSRLISRFGREKARQYGEANLAAIDLIERLVAELRIDCDFARLPFYTFARSEGTLKQVQEEAEAAQGLGLPASFVEALPAFPVEAKGAVRFERMARFHPLRYLLALAASIPGGGSAVCELSRVTGLEEGEPCTVTTAGGTVKAREVVIATHYPILSEAGFYFARLHAERHYVLAFTSEHRFPQAMLCSAERGGFSYRSTPFEGGELILIDNGSHKTGEGGDTRGHYRGLADHVRAVFPGSRIRYHWSAQGIYTLDGVPYIGTITPGSKHLFTATGFQAWGMANGTAAALILSDLIRTGSSPWAPVFDPHRYKPVASAAPLLSQAGTVIKAFVARRLVGRRFAPLEAGDGKVVRSGKRTVGVHKAPDGRLRAVDVSCTHMHCILGFNRAEQSWDCPCHGSRFDLEGKVLHAPAVTDLERVDLAERREEDR